MEQTSSYLHRDPLHIREDLRRTAERVWGREAGVQDRMDPLVDLLFSAFAQELFGLQQEILDHRRRTSERAARMLLPDEVITARPAHAIFQGKPVDPGTWTHRSQMVFSTTHGMDIHDRVGRGFAFTPADEFRLHRGVVRHMVHGNKLFGHDPRSGLRRVLLTGEEGTFAPQEFWLGVHLDEAPDPQVGLPFYFQLPQGDPDEWSVLMHLPACKVELNGEPVHVEIGSQPRTRRELHFQDIADPVRMAEREAVEYYRHKFLTLRPPVSKVWSATGPSGHPPRFGEVFGREMLEQVDPGLHWVRLVFPSVVNAKALEKLQGRLNCFPALNRSRHERTASRRQLVPLVHGAGQQFWAVDEVMDAQGRTLHAERAGGAITSERLPTYGIRRGDIERPDHREAYERLMGLLHTVQEDHAAFATLNEMELADGLERVEHWLEEYRRRFKRPPFPPVYLLLDKLPEANIHVAHWSTEGTAAHTLPPLKPFRLEKGTYMLGDLRMLTTPMGGADTPREGELVARLRSGQGQGTFRLPTLHMIKMLGMDHIPEELRSSAELEVGRFLGRGRQASSGLVRRLSLTIRVLGHEHRDRKAWEAVREHVRNALARKLGGIMPVDVELEMTG